MIFVTLARTIDIIANTLVILVIISTLLSYFVSPYHPVRQSLDKLITPLIAPIRRVVPPLGMIDFSPLVLIILIEILSFLITSFLYGLA
ncbi:MAG: YggT family protein [Chloroflexota bacterium]